MPMWLLNQRKRFFEENNWNESTGWENKETQNSDSPKNDWGEKKDDSIPYSRFKEVNDRMKEAEAKLQAIEDEKKAKAEEEAIKKWEYEKIISQKDQEISDFKKKEESWKIREELVKSKNEERLQKLEKDFGENWNSVKGLVDDITDPFILSNKLDSLEAMKWVKTTTWQQWGSNIPWSWGTSRKQELMDKLQKGEQLTAKERNELLTATSN